MRLDAECYVCMMEQALRAGRLSGLTGDALGEAMRETAAILKGVDPALTPPGAAVFFYRRIKELSGVEDPYRHLKSVSNRSALDLLPGLRREAAGAPDPLAFALRAAVAGNIVDFGNRSGPGDLEGSLRNVTTGDLFVDHTPYLRSDLEGASSLLLLCDNAGEIVMDRLLCEVLTDLYPGLVLTAAVRGGPMINDATVEDAVEAGLDGICEVISTGYAMAGIDLEKSALAFRQAFAAADVIIAKGQGNFESLEGRGENVYHLFQVKCECVADYLAAEKGAALIWSLRRRE